MSARPKLSQKDSVAAQQAAAQAAGAARQPNLAATLIKRVLILAILGAAIVWAFRGIPFDFTHFRHGLETGKDYIWQMFPHSRDDLARDTRSLHTLKKDLLDTIRMAIAGTVLGTIPAFLLSFLAARTTSLWRPLSSLVKTFLNIGRSVPILVYGLIIVSAIGLGPQAGMLAVTVGSFVMLAKLYAEALESVALGPVEAVKAAGGNATQVFVFGMLPQVFPNFLSATLYSFELNLQASFILAFVGAGGIGFDLQNDIQLQDLLEAGVIIAILVVFVNLVDYVSYRIRQVFS